MKTALLLPGGGSAGITQLGMVRAILKLGTRIDAVYATSVGCITGMFLLQNQLDVLEELWMAIQNEDVYKHGPIEILTSWKRKSLYDSSPLKEKIEQHYQPARKPLCPFFVTATNMRTGNPQTKDINTLGHQEAVSWLVASASPPIFMPPTDINNMIFTDGAVLSNFNVRQAVKDGADRLIVLCPKSSQIDYKIENILDVLMFSLTASSGYMLRHELAFVEMLNKVGAPYRYIKTDLIQPDNPWNLSLLSFDLGSREQRKRYIDEGYAAAYSKLVK